MKATEQLDTRAQRALPIRQEPSTRDKNIKNHKKLICTAKIEINGDQFVKIKIKIKINVKNQK